MEIITYVMLAFGALAAIDRIIGNKIGLGAEFEKGIEMLGTLTLSMAGMLVMAPLISHLLSGVKVPFDISILPASLLANDMGGAHLSQELAKTEPIGLFNGLIVSSMMGCTVSFTLPYVLQATPTDKHADIMYGLLCGIVTVPVGCIASGLMLGVPLTSLVTNLIPLVIFAAIIALGLIFFKKITVKIFTLLGIFIKIVITVGLFSGIAEYLTGFKLIPHTGALADAMDIIINIACIMVGAFPLLSIVKKLLSPLLTRLGRLIGVNASSALGLISTVGTSVSTFEMAGKMDKKGLVLNSAFAVSASFVFVDHLAFTLSFDARYVPAMIVGKLVSGISSVVLASILLKGDKTEKTA